MSKEEILEKVILVDTEESPDYTRTDVMSAMDIWGKQEAIGFAQWATHNDYTYLPSQKCWVNEEIEESNKVWTDEQLYSLYQKSKI